MVIVGIAVALVIIGSIIVSIALTSVGEMVIRRRRSREWRDFQDET
jgi:hypothetical protein